MTRSRGYFNGRGHVLFLALVTAMNVFGSQIALGALGDMLELRRQGCSPGDVIGHFMMYGIWPTELWMTSVVVSRYLVRARCPNLAATTALLPAIAMLGTKVLNNG